jgi:hypothetical protein
MSDFSLASSDLQSAALAEFGEPITYIGAKGADTDGAIATVAILCAPTLLQSGTPGYFADLEVDPVVVVNPQKGDRVVWADGSVYEVARVVQRPYQLTKLAVHRKVEAIPE